jgi:glycosyltransferase involved in cell wall biosynthesis
MIEKLVWRGFWWHGRHNNCRYASLLPRLTLVEPDYKRLSQWSIISGVQRRFDRWFLRYTWEPLWMQLLARQYCGCFGTELHHIDLFPGPIVMDVDDPKFDTDLVSRLNHPRVVSVVTTTSLLRSVLIESGLKAPCFVIPSGVDLEGIDSAKSQRLMRMYPRELGTIRLGYVLPRYYLDEEIPEHNRELKLRSISWLLKVMRAVWISRPEIELWLLGKPSKEAERVCSSEGRIKMLGYIPYEEILTYYSLFDIALYPRTVDFQGRHSIKLIEFMACGLPIVSTDVSESLHVARSEAGLICDSQEAFVEAILRLAGNATLRRTFGEKGRRYAQAFNWDRLAERYEADVLRPVIERLCESP